MKSKALSVWTIVLATSLLLVTTTAAAQGGSSLESHKSVIGPRNHFLADGAEALVNGYAVKGVELTEKGLKIAQGPFEKKAALSNLCAGYLMINKPKDALKACDAVIELDPDFWRAYNNRALVYLELGQLKESEADVMRGEELRPKSRNLQITKSKVLDALHPVEPTVEIDERRNAGEDDLAAEKTM